MSQQHNAHHTADDGHDRAAVVDRPFIMLDLVTRKHLQPVELGLKRSSACIHIDSSRAAPKPLNIDLNPVPPRYEHLRRCK